MLIENAMMQSFTNHLGIDFVRIRAGRFRLGVVEGDTDAEWNESPAFTTIVAEDFFLATKPITRAQFSQYLVMPEGEFSSTEQGQPANHLSALNADEFVAAINAHRPEREKHLQYLLPSETEWEYACRAGTTTRFYFGDDPDFSELENHAWFANNTWDKGLRSPQISGAKGANAWGLYDMHGNVWEWTRDGWGLYEEIVQYGDSARDGTSRVLRGGGWCHEARYIRASDRDHYPLDYHHYYTGMRLAFRLI